MEEGGAIDRLLRNFVPGTYVTQGLQALHKRHALFRHLLEHKRLPEEGWDEPSIEYIVNELALMDSNNFLDNVGMGEREARVYCSLVSKRHYRFGHGVGRSGDIAEPQPKAAGSSLLVQLTNHLILDALHVAGFTRLKHCALLPVATGMCCTLVLLSLQTLKPAARYVLWSRIDQKSCLKAILTAGLTPVPIACIREGDELRTDVEGFKAALDRLGQEDVLCVVSTTSCFAPRAPDRIRDLAVLCKEAGVFHVVNNAYGVQCSKVAHAMNEAVREGRVDICIQSTDKNFLVPVGGAVVASADPEAIARVCKSYPGRASGAPLLDVFMTLLNMGRKGYASLLRERKELVKHFQSELSQVAAKHGERLLHSPANTISFGMSLENLTPSTSESSNNKAVSFFGSMLFIRCVSGTRVVPRHQTKAIEPLTFSGYGAHVEDYPVTYLTAACAIGVRREEIDGFIQRLDKALVTFKRRKGRGAGGSGQEGGGEGVSTSIEAPDGVPDHELHASALPAAVEEGREDTDR